MGQMFRNCDKLVELDVSNFDMSKVENMYGMLNGCTSLEAIKLGAKTQLNNAELPVREWQLASLSYTPVRYDALDGYDGANPGWYLQGYADLVIDGLADAVYTGEPITQTPMVSVGERALVENVDYTVSFADNTDAGTATVTVAGIGIWTGSADATFEIASKSIEPTLILSQETFAYNGSAQTPEVTVKKAQGKITYKVVKWGKNAKKYVKVSKAGKVTVKKGARKGTYTLKIKVTAAGNANYEAKSKTVTLKVRVK